jgi:hypothetical protein
MWKMLKDADGLAGILGMIFGAGFLVFTIILMLNQPQVAPEFASDQMNSNALLLGIGVVSFGFGFYKFAQYQEYQQRWKQWAERQAELDAEREVAYVAWKKESDEYQARYKEECRKASEDRYGYYPLYSPPDYFDEGRYLV